MTFSSNTARDIACARGVCKEWSSALSALSLRTDGGLEAVCFTSTSSPRLDTALFSSALGVRTRILHVFELDDPANDVLHLASEQCAQISELRLFGVRCVVHLAPRWPLLTYAVFERCCQLADASTIALARASPLLASVDLSSCWELTDASIQAIACECPGLTKLVVSGISSLTDASIGEVARWCPVLTGLCVNGCSKLTSSCKATFQRQLPSCEQP